MIYETIRPITGKAQTPFKGDVSIPIGKEVTHVDGDLYETWVFNAVKLRPVMMNVSRVRFTLNPHIAMTDMRAKT